MIQFIELRIVSLTVHQTATTEEDNHSHSEDHASFIGADNVLNVSEIYVIPSLTNHLIDHQTEEIFVEIESQTSEENFLTAHQVDSQTLFIRSKETVKTSFNHSQKSVK